jgi:hypothetical protein
VDQAAVGVLKGLLLFVEHGQASAQVQKFAVTFLAAGTQSTT